MYVYVCIFSTIHVCLLNFKYVFSIKHMSGKYFIHGSTALRRVAFKNRQFNKCVQDTSTRCLNAGLFLWKSQGKSSIMYN